MNVVLMIADILIILAFLGLIAACGAVVFVALRMKRDVVRNAKRLYEPPLRSAKNIVTAGKGLVQQETVRVQHGARVVRETAAVVRTAVVDLRRAVEIVRDIDWQPILSMAQAGMQFASTAAKVARSASKQSADA